jgi:arylsulfatase A
MKNPRFETVKNGDWRRADSGATRGVGLLLLLAGIVWCGGPARAADAPPNIVFILCDDLGINDLHCYGRTDHRTPHLDRLATQGTRFTSAYAAQPICSPSRAAILTGQAPARLHLTTYLPGRPDRVSHKVLHPEIELQVGLDQKMLPRYFREAGYVTAAVGKWHVGGQGFGPLDHGFDVAHAGQSRTVPSPTEGSKGEYNLTAAAEQFIEEHRNRPFLVYLAHHTPHITYGALPDQIQRNDGAFEPVYAAVIETLDDTVGRLLAKLDALQLADNTIVVFTSDNGGLHVPEGPHPRITHNTPYRAGKGFIYEGGMRVPLIVRWPGRIPAGKVIDEPVINTDWIPTLLELVGRPAPSGLDGVSFAPLLLGQRTAPARQFFWHFPHYTNQGGRPTGAIRDGVWMLVEYYDGAPSELYDLTADIGQQDDVATQHPQRVAALGAALAAWRQSVSAQANRPNPDFDPAKFRELYEDVQPDRFDPLRATDAQWETIQQWRKGMNSAPRVKPVPARNKRAKTPASKAEGRKPKG